MIGMLGEDITVPESPAEMLRELQDALLEMPDFLKTRRISDPIHDAYLAEKPDPQQQELLKEFERERRAARRMEKMLWHLGKERFEPAIPALVEIWVDGALPALQTTAAHALFAMHTDEARQALESTMDRDDRFRRFMGIKAVFDGAPDRAYDRFEPLFASVDAKPLELAQEVLWFLCPSAQQWKDGKEVQVWTEPRVRGWLADDVRWLDLCAGLRRHPHFGRGAREVLRHVDPSQRTAALARARANEPSGKPEARTKSSGDLLDRYRRGEFEAVWEEIRTHQHIGGDFREEVMSVAEATMERVARNADLISERLENLGWRALSGNLRTEPSANDRVMIDQVETITGGPVPPTLLAFWTVVGGIDWIWDYRSEQEAPDLGVDLPLLEFDPLSVDPAGVVDWLFEEWEAQKDQPDPELIDPFSLDLAPDHYMKANYGGGSAYAIELPFFGADPVFANEPHELPFVDYLRLCFQWAGFPGLEKHEGREDVRQFVKAFGEGVEPF